MRRFTCFLAAAAVLFASSCTKKEVAPANPSENLRHVVFGAGLEAQTKADLVDMKLVWSESDKIGVWDGTAVREFSVTSCDGTSATFEGDVAADAEDFWAVYPYNASMTVAEGVVTTSIPSVQTISAGKVADPNALVCVARFDEADGVASFKNVVSLLKFDVAEGENVASVYVRGNAAEKISGTVKFDADAVVSSAGSDYVTLKAAGTVLSAGTYYIAVAPATLTSGIRVCANIDDDSKVILKKEGEVVLARNGGKNAGDVVANPAAVVVPDAIMTKAELIAWAENADMYFVNEEVKLGADIDLGGEEWAPAKNFYGTFNGQNHNISGLVVTQAPGNAAFIATLGNSAASESAVVKNLNVGTKDGNTYDGVSKVELVSADNSGYKYAGGVVAYAHNGSLFENVKNYVPVTVAEACKCRHRAGGISGTAKASVTFHGCTNYAKIEDNQTSITGSTGNLNIGGITSMFDGDACSVIDCVNEGAIINHGIYTVSIGGIVGAIANKGTVENCVNRGEVNQGATCIGDNGYSIRVGGICGGVTTKAGTVIIKCENSGKVKLSAAQQKISDKITCSTGMGGIVGVVGISATIKGCSNSATVAPVDVQVATGLCAGGIVGYLTGSTSALVITKADDGTRCKNTGAISPAVNFSTTYYMGGIVGNLNGGNGTIVEYCDNAATVKASGKLSGTVGTQMGGVCGSAKNALIQHCTNSGLVQITASDNNGSFNAGGILGGSASPFKILDCLNSGQIQVGKGKTMNAAGISANFDPKADEITDCSNTGKLLITRGAAVRSAGIVAISKRAVSSEVTMLEGCSCDMDVQASENALNGYLGIIVGVFYNTEAELNGHTATINVGSTSKPVRVKLGRTWKENTADTWGSFALDASNYCDYVIGQTSTSGRDNDLIVFHTTTF